MKILFVDDEQMLLDGIKRTLRAQKDWDSHFTTSAEDALVILQKEPFDVIVTDMRMPNMNGAQLLQEVSSNFPDMVRIVLSGYSELKIALREVPVAHHFLLKPCRAPEMRRVINRAVGLQQHLSLSETTPLFSSLRDLPPTPLIHASLTKVLMDPNATPESIVEIIDARVGLKDQILALANSLLVVHKTQTNDIFQAIFRLGFQRVKHLVFSVEVFDTWAGNNEVSADLVNNLRNHSIGVSQLAERFFSNDQSSDDAFIAGMLHDVGKLLIAIKFPNEQSQIIELVKKGQAECAAERAILGTDHAFLGAYLLNRWGLPYPIIEAVAFHHTPLAVTDQPPHRIDLLSAVYFANQLQIQQPFDKAYVKMLQMEDDIDNWKTMLLSDHM